jgi:hypothetical protein
VRTDATVSVAEGDEQPRKLVRIAGLADGSLKVFVPYHPALDGFAAKLDLGGSRHGLSHTGFAAIAEGYTVPAPIGLSLHSGGFTQFSTAGKIAVRSGVKPFAIPKGLGLHHPPLTEFPATGPLFIVSFDDIRACKALGTLDKNVQSLVVPEQAIFNRDEHFEGSAHQYWVEGFVLPADVRREAIFDHGWWLDREYSSVRPDWQVRFRVLDLPTPLYFLAVLVSRSHREPSDSIAYTITSPRDHTRQYALMARFPADVAAEGSLARTMAAEPAVSEPE